MEHAPTEERHKSLGIDNIVFCVCLIMKQSVVKYTCLCYSKPKWMNDEVINIYVSNSVPQSARRLLRLSRAAVRSLDRLGAFSSITVNRRTCTSWSANMTGVQDKLPLTVVFWQFSAGSQTLHLRDAVRRAVTQTPVRVLHGHICDSFLLP